MVGGGEIEARESAVEESGIMKNKNEVEGELQESCGEARAVKCRGVGPLPLATFELNSCDRLQ
jgi:hypothetical protein